ncbi:retrovirus-related Pol polyprotein from transposon 17.6 [Trichonephila clavipes]|nr:retrovirus-related Pol polyprotein from transposon 17.6 [Trichonephila clavipes]
MVVQLKKRANASMKDHFLDNWANLKSATQIAELFDNYEDVRKVNSKPMDRWGRNDKILTYSGIKEKENRFGKTSPRLGASVPESTRERTFEKRVIQRCYHCNMPGHIKAGCPKLIKNKTTETNNIEGNENPDFLNSYTTKGSVNGHEIDILRDTGATIDLVCAKYINPSSFSGENVWVKQPLSPELVCLPLAVVEISGNFGTVQTKAAVCGNHLNQHGRYLLGNKTAELIKGNLGYNFLPVEILNAVQTRSQVKAAREERGIDSGDAKKREDEVIIVSSDAEDEILIPALQEYVPELALLRVTRENLINAQKNSEEIKPLYEQAASQVQVTNQCSDYRVFERFGILVRHSSVYHPQSNPVERFHRTLKRLLMFRCRLRMGQKHLPSILLALRTVSHESTGHTPSELVYGKNLRTPETLVMEHWMEPEEEGDLVTEYMFKLINRLKRCQEVAINKMEEMQVKRKKKTWQIPLSKTAQRYAAFCTSFGTYRPLRMSFGLKNAPYFFSKLMAELLNGLEDFVVPYLDDIAIFSDTWESHIKHMETVLQRIKRARLTIKPKVYSGLLPKIYKSVLGNCCSVDGCVEGRAKKGEIKWTTECENAFQLKGKLIDKPVLYAPNFEREFIVQTDASNAGMGAVLTQLTEQGEEHPILYLSKKFSEVEKRYCTTEKECASIVFAIKRLHYYLDGNSFLVMTDHNPLVWLNRNVISNPRLMRWALALQPYNFRIVHRSGKSHKNADSLSRSVIDN